MNSTIVSDLLRIAKHDRNFNWEKEAVLKERAANYITELEQKIAELEQKLKDKKSVIKKKQTD